jgi:hypothetical protein
VNCKTHEALWAQTKLGKTILSQVWFIVEKKKWKKHPQSREIGPNDDFGNLADYFDFFPRF